jgi:carbon storage regulator
MLILMRRAGESIHIGPNIVVTLVSLDRNRARIGVQAPRDITVDREEIAKKKQAGVPAAKHDVEDSDERSGNEREARDESSE